MEIFIEGLGYSVHHSSLMHIQLFYLYFKSSAYMTPVGREWNICYRKLSMEETRRALTLGVAFGPHLLGWLYLMLVLYTSGAAGQVWPAVYLASATSTSIDGMSVEMWA